MGVHSRSPTHSLPGFGALTNELWMTGCEHGIVRTLRLMSTLNINQSNMVNNLRLASTLSNVLCTLWTNQLSTAMKLTLSMECSIILFRNEKVVVAASKTWSTSQVRVQPQISALYSTIRHLDVTDIKLIYYNFLTTRSYNSDGPWCGWTVRRRAAAFCLCCCLHSTGWCVSIETWPLTQHLISSARGRNSWKMSNIADVFYLSPLHIQMYS